MSGKNGQRGRRKNKKVRQLRQPLKPALEIVEYREKPALPEKSRHAVETKKSKRILTDKANSALGGLTATLYDLLGYALTLLKGCVGLLPFVVPLALGLLMLNGTLTIGENGHRVLGICLVLFSGLSGVLTFAYSSYGRGLIYAAQLISISGVLASTFYFFYGAFMLTAVMLLACIAIGAGMYYLHRRLYETKNEEIKL